MFSFFKKNKKCEICSNPKAKKFSIPKLNDPTEAKYTKKILCHSHFFKEFKNIFLAHPYKMIVTNPIKKAGKEDFKYGYFTIKEFERFDFNKKEIDFVKNMLNKIPNDKECAYLHLNESRISEMFNKRTMELNTLTIQPSKLIFDKIEYTSKDEAWNKIQDIIYKNKDATAIPYGKEGIFLSVG